MARFRFLTRLKRAWLASKKRGIVGFASGFTLIELLVSMIIAAIITVSLLGLVVGLVDVNKRDAEQTEVQQGMQAAMDYISEELRESIFVYDNACLVGQGTMGPASTSADCPGLVKHIPASLEKSIVLAFWRTNLLPQKVLDTCKTYSTGGGADGKDQRLNDPAVRNIPCIAGRGYTLVVYTLQTGSTDVWRGKARLARYQLPQFNDRGDPVDGYVDPLNSAEIEDLRFQHWPWQKAKDNATLTLMQKDRPTADTSAVLVDFLDDKAPDPKPGCPLYSSPTYNTNAAGFHACVRGKIYSTPDPDPAIKKLQEAEQGVKQEIVVSLKGAVPERKGNLFSELGSAADKKLAPLQTRVLSRSILR